jgi:hypothetical protein
MLRLDGSALELDSGDVYNEETLSSTVRVRKQPVIADPRACTAVLMVGPGGDLRIEVNGRPRTLEAPRGVGFAQWQTYGINPSALRPGLNDVVICGQGRVWIARADDSYVALPGRSTRSADGGVSWNVDRLGPNGDISGEYCVRVYLEHYRAQGSILLPAMDAANLSGSTLTPPLASPGPLRLSVQAQTKAQQRVSVRVRSGTPYVPREDSWSGWTALPRTRSSSVRSRPPAANEVPASRRNSLHFRTPVQNRFCQPSSWTRGAARWSALGGLRLPWPARKQPV